jgi:hypothetical protein
VTKLAGTPRRPLRRSRVRRQRVPGGSAQRVAIPESKQLRASRASHRAATNLLQVSGYARASRTPTASVGRPAIPVRERTPGTPSSRGRGRDRTADRSAPSSRRVRVAHGRPVLGAPVSVAAVGQIRDAAGKTALKKAPTHPISPIPGSKTTPAKEHRRSVPALIVAAIIVLFLVAGGFALMRHQSAAETTAPNPPDAGARSGFPAAAPSYGTLVKARIKQSGHVVTNTWMSLRTPIRTLDLHSQPLSAGDNRFAPVISHLSVTADGRAVPLRHATIRARAVTVRLPKPARYVHLRYRVSGVVQTHAHSPSGRALILTDGLAVLGAPGTVPETIALSGVDVLQVSCEYQNRPPSPCGVQHGRHWTVTAKGRATAQRVIAQVDLPAGR